MRLIATDTHDFPSLRRDGKIYVDKTMFIHRLVSGNDTKLFFMSRPRRFGKSLTVSALNNLKREDVLDIDYENVPNVAASEFDVAELRRLTPKAMLYQSGYLTIRDYDPDSESYTPGVPDEDVRQDLCTLMAGVAADRDIGLSFDSKTRHLVDFAAVSYGDAEASATQTKGESK